MAHQEAIGLTDKQRSTIQDAVKDAQGRVVDIQFKMSAEMEKLQHLLQIFTPDEPKVLDEVNRVLTLERDMKLVQMTLMVRIKSQLTERQQGAARPDARLARRDFKARRRALATAPTAAREVDARPATPSAA